MSKTVAEVLIFRGIPSTYTYLIPEENSEHYSAGKHVTVPLGRSRADGVILSIQEAASEHTHKLKAIHSHSEEIPDLSEEFVALIPWFSQYYHSTPYKSYQTIIGKRSFRLPKVLPELTLTPSPHTLNEEQQRAFDTISSESQYSEHLIHGITGSGKTEIYMRLTEHILKQEKSIIICCPEISLTPQYTEAFKARFGDAVAVIHSGLTPKQRNEAWSCILTGKSPVIIGPRSAIFAPCPTLGMIIIDEEHDNSYKQDNHPRYYTHHIAKWRCQFHNCPLVLGSATPSVNSFSHAKKKESNTANSYNYLSKRATGSELPKVQIIDMTEQEETVIDGLSQPLIKAIEEKLSKKEKIIILLNRRGYAHYIVCQSCQKIHDCPDCGLSYTYHSDKSFRCHRCDIKIPFSHRCNKCNKDRLSFSGSGIQKIELSLNRLFKTATIIRIDKDNSKTAKQLEKTLTTFKESGDILIGTQLIAKGHHIEDVTLVGILSIDTQLQLPDFRSSERAFQLMMQVAGRAGRGAKAGHVYIQTHQAEHYAVTCAAEHNYDEFIDMESSFREALYYPPYAELTHVIFSCPNQKTLQTHCKEVEKKLKSIQLPETIQVLGPKVSPIEKVRNHYRQSLLFKHSKEDQAQIREILKSLPTAPPDCRVIPDFDPQQLL